MSLHDKIMNITVDPDIESAPRTECRIAYKAGHRDARHAAAELSIEMEHQLAQLREALIALRADGAWINGEWVPSDEADALSDEAIRDSE